MDKKVKIQIYRKQKFAYSMVNAIVMIDGNEVGTVGNGKTAEIIVGEGTHQLEVSFKSSVVFDDTKTKASIDFKVDKKTKDYDLIFDYELISKKYTPLMTIVRLVWASAGDIPNGALKLRE